MYGIVGKKKGSKKFRPFCYRSGEFGVVHQTLWNDISYVQILVGKIIKKNPGFEFKTIKVIVED